MAFKRPGNSRDDKSGRSSSRTTKAGDRPKRSSTSRGNSSSGSDQTGDNKSNKKYSTERSGEKKSFSSSGSKPFKSREGGFDKPASSFSGGPGERKPFAGKSRPYSGRPSDAGESSGEKRSFAKGRPYTGRTADNDPRPPKSFGGDKTGDKKPFTSRGKSAGSFDSGDRPKRSSDSYRDSGERATDKKPFSSRSKSPGSFNTDDKPKRSPGSYRDGGERTGDKKFGVRPSAGSGFKRTTSDKPYNADRPQRSKPSYDKITPDLDKPAKTLRGRKKGPESKDTGLIRLNRYISNAGICSRRKADELIAAGVVSVNGTVINELGHKVDFEEVKEKLKQNFGVVFNVEII